MKAVFLDTATLGPDDVDLGPLTRQLPGLEFFPATPPARVAERIAAAEIVFVNKVRLSGELLAAAPNLKLICLAATGTDNVDLRPLPEQVSGSVTFATTVLRPSCSMSLR